MNTEVDDGKRCEQRVGKDRVAVPIPTTVIVKPRQAKPDGEWNSNVERRHTVGERVNASEPISDFRRQRIGEGLHFRDGVARHSDVEEEVERYGKDVDPSN